MTDTTINRHAQAETHRAPLRDIGKGTPEFTGNVRAIIYRNGKVAAIFEGDPAQVRLAIARHREDERAARKAHVEQVKRDMDASAREQFPHLTH